MSFRSISNLLFAILLQSNFGWSQHDTVFVHNTGEDSVSVEMLFYPQGISTPPVLVGTMALFGSPITQTLYDAHVYLNSLEKGEGCPQGSRVRPGPNEIQVVRRDSGTLVLDVQFESNCCFDFLGEAYAQGDTLVLKTVKYGTHCGCTCCHEVRWTFSEWVGPGLEDLSLKFVRTEDEPEIVIALPDSP